MQKIYHKRNELLEVEFYQDEDCKIPFDFTDAKDLYIELKGGDCTPAIALSNKLFALNLSAIIYTPLWHLGYRDNFNSKIILITLNDIQCKETKYRCNLSKYIPENNAVLFLNDNDFQDYNKYFLGSKFSLIQYPILDKCNLRKSLNFTIFLHYGTQSELQKANEIAKELKEKYGVEEVNVFVLPCFVLKRLLIKTIRPSKIDRMYDNEIYGYKMQKICNNINKIITTNSTSILEPQDNEKLQVIDCFDIFNDSIGLTTDETIIKSTNNIGGILQKLADR